MKTLFELLKKYWYVILILLVVGIFGVQRCTINKLKDQVQLKNVQLSTLNDSVFVLKGRNGDLTFKVQSVQVETDNAKKALELAGFEIKDLRQRDVKWRKVNFALQAQLEAAGSGTITLHDSILVPVKGDTIMAKVGSWNNNFLFLNPFLVKNKLDFDYKYKVGIKVLSETSSTVSIGLTDPKATITGSNSITINKKKPWWGWDVLKVGVGIGVGYLIFK